LEIVNQCQDFEKSENIYKIIDILRNEDENKHHSEIQNIKEYRFV
jgi:hypothetical protein